MSEAVVSSPFAKSFTLNSKFLLLLAMVFITVSTAADTVAYKFVGLDHVLVSGASVLFPITYCIGDSIAEVYGYAILRKIIWFGLACELMFAVLIELVIHLHSPSSVPHQKEFNVILGSMLRFVFSGIVADVAGSFLNAYLITKWKVLVRGRYFWFRSLISIACGELVMVLIIVLAAFLGFSDVRTVFSMLVSAYILHLLYAIVLVWPTWLMTYFLKKSEEIDVYDISTNFNPFRL